MHWERYSQAAVDVLLRILYFLPKMPHALLDVVRKAVVHGLFALVFVKRVCLSGGLDAKLEGGRGAGVDNAEASTQHSTERTALQHGQRQRSIRSAIRSSPAKR